MDSLDFDKIFTDVSWLHFTGITSALSDSAAALTKAARIAEKQYDVTVSADLNFRKKFGHPKKHNRL